jgi:hypothetical protein
MTLKESRHYVLWISEWAFLSRSLRI